MPLELESLLPLILEFERFFKCRVGIRYQITHKYLFFCGQEKTYNGQCATVKSLRVLPVRANHLYCGLILPLPGHKDIGMFLGIFSEILLKPVNCPGRSEFLNPWIE